MLFQNANGSMIAIPRRKIDGWWQRTKKIKNISDMDSARLAMAIDCEGSVVVCKRGHTKRLKWRGKETRILIYNTDLRLLDWAFDVTGLGTIRKHNNGSGALPTKKITWVWECSYLSSYQVLKRVLPWLILKREKALESLDWYSNLDLCLE